MVVAKGQSILVLRRAHLPRRGFLDLPGGFIEPGEGIEAAARRELLEETGLRVGRAEELGFYWDRYYLKGFGHFPTMNFYYLARWRSGVSLARPTTRRAPSGCRSNGWEAAEPGWRGST